MSKVGEGVNRVRLAGRGDAVKYRDQFTGTRSMIFNEIVLKANHFLNNVT